MYKIWNRRCGPKTTTQPKYVDLLKRFFGEAQGQLPDLIQRILYDSNISTDKTSRLYAAIITGLRAMRAIADGRSMDAENMIYELMIRYWNAMTQEERLSNKKPHLLNAEDE